MVPGAVIWPAPLSQVTLFFLKRNSTPLTLAETTSSFAGLHAGEVELDAFDHDAVFGL